MTTNRSTSGMAETMGRPRTATSGYIDCSESGKNSWMASSSTRKEKEGSGNTIKTNTNASRGLGSEANSGQKSGRESEYSNQSGKAEREGSPN